MKDLAATVRRVQLLENAAADKAGVRFLLVQEEMLLGKGRDEYIRHYIELLLADIAPEVIEAARTGKAFAWEILG
jgi:hypothetical protein